MRCIDCRHYPWQPEADPSMLPQMTCHPAMGPQRWTRASAAGERHCPRFARSAGGMPGVEVALPSYRVAAESEQAPQTIVPDDYTAKQLRAKAEQLGLAPRRIMNKAQLANMINEHLRG